MLDLISLVESTGDPASGLAIDEQWARKNPDAAQAELATNQDRLFDRAFRDYEDAAIDFASDRGVANDAADNAKRAASTAFAGNGTRRQLARYGRMPSEGLADALSRSRAFSSARSQAQGANQARMRARDLQTSTSSGLMNIGQGISQNASQSLSTAGGMAAQREQIGNQRAAQNKQSLVSTGLTVAAAAAFGL